MRDTSRRTASPLPHRVPIVATLLLLAAALQSGAHAATAIDAVSLSGIRSYSNPGRVPAYDSFEYDETGFLNFNNDPFESRTVVEFPTATIPGNAPAFQLRSSLGSYSGSVPKSVEVYAYPGDGIASLADFDVGNQVGSATISDFGEFAIVIDESSIEAIRATSPFVGFTLRVAGTQGPPGYVNIFYLDTPIQLDVLGDEPPIANAGWDQSIRAGQTVNLDGIASYDDNTSPLELSYQWRFAERPSGSVAVIVGADTASPSFVADVADRYSVELIVTDSAGQASQPDYVEISSQNLAPTANAGADQLLVVGNFVQLDGNGSTDPDNDGLTFSWSLAVPPDSSATLFGVDWAVPFFTPDVEGSYTATLYVADLLGEGEPDTVTITVVSTTNYVDRRVAEAAALVDGLPAASVTSPGNRVAFTNILAQIVDAGRRGNTAEQIRKLEDALSRTDGCWVYGAVDANGPGMDWITKCDAQIAVYTPLTAALDAVLATIP